MRKLADVIKNINEEIKDANKYYIKALTSDEPSEKETYKELSIQELEHANKLHSIVTNIIEEETRKGIQAPEGMLKIWEFEHGQIIQDVEDIKKRISKI